MSLEYFGGKRTGDLISRVSSDSDRICYFLSVNLLDFANDVLTFVMTAIILLTHRLAARPGDAHAAAGHRLPGPPRPQPAAKRFPVGQPRLGRNDERAGRYDPRHSRRQGIRPGDTARSIASAAPMSGVLQANDRVNRLWSFFGPVITLLTDAGLLIVWIVGVWQVFHRPRDGRHAGTCFWFTSPAFTCGWSR